MTILPTRKVTCAVKPADRQALERVAEKHGLSHLPPEEQFAQAIALVIRRYEVIEAVLRDGGRMAAIRRDGTRYTLEPI